MESLKKTRITGLGIYIPPREISNETVLELLEKNSKHYLDMTGESTGELIKSAKAKIEKAGSKIRYWCEPHQYCTDIAFEASVEALKDANLKAADIDLIIYSGMSRAFVEPATAHVLRYQLGAVNAELFDTQDACTSFMKSIQIADAFIKTGTYKTVLIAAGERTYDWADFTCKNPSELEWKIGSLTIGDAAGAMILQETSDTNYSNSIGFYYVLGNGDYPVCTVGLNHWIGERYKLYTHSSQLIQKILTLSEEMKDILRRELEGLELDTVLMHDIGVAAQKPILGFLQDEGINTDSFKPFFPDFGNVASASLPLSMYLARKDGRLKRGNLALFLCPAAGIQLGAMIFRY
ncbi:MAG: hypothetical protein GY754_21980 [bacterium]|nr:hypothetical protein [bacterium]